MKGFELLNFIIKDSLTLSKFGGIFAVDQLTFLIPNREIFYICNTDISSKEGLHWVVIYSGFKDSSISYFDPLGEKPSSEFINFMSNNVKKRIQFNSKRLQSSYSEHCGYYCLYFIHEICRGLSFENIVNNFSSNLDVNENFVIDFVNQSFL